MRASLDEDRAQNGQSSMAFDVAVERVPLFGSLYKQSRTMTFRLTALFVAIALLMGAVIFLIIFYQTNAILSQQVAHAVRAETQDLKMSARHGGTALVAQLIDARMGEGQGRLYLLADGMGRRITGNIATRPPALKPDGKGGAFRYVPAGAAGNLSASLAAGSALRLADGHWLLIGRDIEQQRRLGHKIGSLFLLGFTGLAVAGLFGGLWASRLVASRIGAISATARSIMSGNLSERVPISGAGDELDGLSTELNQMLQRIERLMASLKEVSDNVAHDLKTPLNRLRNHAEAALREAGTGEGSHAAYKRALENITEEADELIKTFNALLLIAKLESRRHEDGIEPVDIEPLVRDIVDLYQPAADEDGRRIDLEIIHDSTAGALRVAANRHLIGQAVANMLDNALKYGAADSSEFPELSPGQDITVLLSSDGGDIRITVADHGPGIPEHERKRVLQRFVRLEKSRSLPGTGLGLSLVNAVTQLSGGRLVMEDNRPGLRLSMFLPKVEA